MKDIKVAIGAIAKCENLYIREWVEYHKNLGIYKIFLYDNNDIDGERFEEVIDDYIKNGYVTIVDYRGRKNDPNGDLHHMHINLQSQMCNHCYKIVSEEYKEIDWLAIIDIDEFIAFSNEFKNIGEFLSQDIFKDCECVRLNWKMYGDSGYYKVENGNYSVARFKEWKIDKLGKSIFKTGLSHLYGIIEGHGSYVSVNFDEEGNRLPIFNNRISIVNPNPKYLHAWINHYKSKTIEEFIIRRCVIKDLVPFIEYKPISFFLYNERTKEKEDWAKIICKKYGIKYE